MREMFQWLQVRIDEERHRRQKEAAILARLPGALEELHRSLVQCAEAYEAAFGPDEGMDAQFHAGKIRIAVRERRGGGRWESTARMEVTLAPQAPGFKIERGTDEPLVIEVGILPNDRLFYRHADKYLTMEEMTRRILDRALFPKLGE